MVVQHNLQAMNANRMLGITTKEASGSTEKLSSGYRINRAADDAAGLAISEKMRKQIRGLSQASENAEDGISCVQTAEGALAEVQDMLQRMNELCVQAANGTNSITDRQYIQDEIDQMVTEIDRISETTKFNELYLLKGDEESGTKNKFMANYKTSYTENEMYGVNGTPSVNYNYTGHSNLYIVDKDIEDADANTPKSAKLISKDVDITQYLNVDATTITSTSYMAFENATIDTNIKNGTHLKTNSTSVVVAKTELYIYDTTTNSIIHLEEDDEVGKYLDDNRMMLDRYRFVEKAEIDFDKEIEKDKSEYVLYDADGQPVSAIALNKYIDDDGNYRGGLFKTSQAVASSSIVATGSVTYAYTNFISITSTEISNPLEFDLHVGSDSNKENKITTAIESISAAGIGIEMLHSNKIGIVDRDGAKATSAVDVIDDALQVVSRQRSALGAVQNRLEHTVKNLDNVVENTTAAESQIRDTDMAEEMVKYSNTNILMQAGQSMLAQANQSNQGVLSLLQG